MAYPRSPFRLLGRFGGFVALPVAVAFLLPSTGGEASAEPAAAAARKELTKLNSRVDRLVDRYDKAKTLLEAAKKQSEALSDEVAAEQRVYRGMHARVAQIAATAYKNGGLDSGAALLAAKDPDAALDQMSTFTALSNSRGQEMKQFVDSAQRLRREQGNARSALDVVTRISAELKKQKAAVQQAVERQERLLRQAGVPVDGGRPSNATYNGPASGPSREAVEFAYAQLGKPYVWGGTGPRGYDCSGLTMMAWRAAGVGLPRVVPDQYNAVHHVARADLRPGDLVFFDDLGHNGIYVGDGKFIHAPHTGTVVQFASISNPYWASHYVGAGRP
jgi:cell wall-associated NlpC family hydrolase